MADAVSDATTDLDAAIVEVMAGLRGHRAWLARWHRHAVCRIPPDPDLVAPDAHQVCRFGRWYAVFSPGTTVPQELLDSVGQLHEELHARARKLSHQIATNTPIEATDYDGLGTVVEQFARRVLDIERLLWLRLAECDPLTGTDTRRAMLARLEREHELVVETGRQSCIAMIDVDHLKQVNDTLGHAAGDDVLREVARCLRDVLRPRDSVFRYGGDEFLICLTDVATKPATSVFERVRRQVAELELGDPPITLSIGLADLDPGVPVATSIERADRALYAAKQAGRNRVACGDP